MHTLWHIFFDVATGATSAVDDVVVVAAAAAAVIVVDVVVLLSYSLHIGAYPSRALYYNKYLLILPYSNG